MWVQDRTGSDDLFFGETEFDEDGAEQFALLLDVSARRLAGQKVRSPEIAFKVALPIVALHRLLESGLPKRNVRAFHARRADHAAPVRVDRIDTLLLQCRRSRHRAAQPLRRRDCEQADAAA